MRAWLRQLWRDLVRAAIYCWMLAKFMAWFALALTIAANSFWEGARQYGLLP